MKVFMPVLALTVIAGSATLYAPKALAHYPCAARAQQCVEEGGAPLDCELKREECEATNHWPDGVKMFNASARPDD